MGEICQLSDWFESHFTHDIVSLPVSKFVLDSADHKSFNNNMA